MTTLCLVIAALLTEISNVRCVPSVCNTHAPIERVEWLEVLFGVKTLGIQRTLPYARVPMPHGVVRGI